MTHPAAPKHAPANLDESWMRAALAAARRAGSRGEVPVGALVVLNGRVLGRGGNATIKSRDPSAHAEIVAIRRAARASGNHRLAGATLFVTLEPCIMCLGAMVQARLSRVVFAADDPKSGATALIQRSDVQMLLNHHLELEGGVLAAEAGNALKAFFKQRREAKKGRVDRKFGQRKSKKPGPR